MNRRLTRAVIPTIAAAYGAITRYDNETTSYDRRHTEALERLRVAHEAYHNRDMGGSNAYYTATKAALHENLRTAHIDLMLVRLHKPNVLTTSIWGGIKGALFPLTVPYYLYKRARDRDYHW